VLSAEPVKGAAIMSRAVERVQGMSLDIRRLMFMEYTS